MQDDTEKVDRQERYRRKRSYAEDTPEETPRRRRATPYKRKHVNYDDYLEEDDWSEM